MFEKLEGLERALAENGKRVQKTLKEDVDKFLWRHKGKWWGAFTAILDTTAKRAFSDIFEFDTYQAARLHHQENGKLVRYIRKDINGTRGRHFRVGKSLTAIHRRLFENWFTWKEVEKEGRTDYIVGFIPLSKWGNGGGFKDLSKAGYISGESSGIYIISEIAPNVCRVTRIQVRGEMGV